jgi:short-subunit dehydrogenase
MTYSKCFRNANLIKNMTTIFNDKVIVVTGGSDGIGKELVHQFLILGAKVATCGRNHDKLYQLQIAHPSFHLHTMVADMGNEEDCKRFIESCITTFGTIDILINNAGISMRALFKDVDLEVIKKVMEINFYGALYCTKYALEEILNNQGQIVSISSIAGYRGLPGRSAYSASKFALNGWMESLRTELYHNKVNVLTVAPGFTASNIRNSALNSEGDAQGESPMDESKMMSSELCAKKIINAMEKRKSRLSLTFTGKRTIWMNKLFPKLTDKLTYKFFFDKDGLLIK